MAIPKLLVVDDDAETRSMMTQFLQQNGSWPSRAKQRMQSATI